MHFNFHPWIHHPAGVFSTKICRKFEILTSLNMKESSSRLNCSILNIRAPLPPIASFLGMTSCKLFMKSSWAISYTEATVQDGRVALPSPSQAGVPPLPFQVNPGTQAARLERKTSSSQVKPHVTKQSKNRGTRNRACVSVSFGVLLYNISDRKKRKKKKKNTPPPTLTLWNFQSEGLGECEAVLRTSPGAGLTAHGQRT